MTVARVDLLGKRVLMGSGVRGPVVSVGIGGDIEVSNERDGGKCRYWFAASEVVEILEESPPAEATPARTKLEAVLAEEWCADGDIIVEGKRVRADSDDNARARAAVAVLGKDALRWLLDVDDCEECFGRDVVGFCGRHQTEYDRIFRAAKALG